MHPALRDAFALFKQTAMIEENFHPGQSIRAYMLWAKNKKVNR